MNSRPDDPVLPSPFLQDHILIMRLGQNDPSAADQLIKKYLSSVQQFAQYILGDKSEAENISQEVFIKLWKKIPDWNMEMDSTQKTDAQQKKARLSTWLYKVTLNLCIDVKRRRNRVEFRDILKNSFFLNLRDPMPSPLEVLEKKQTHHKVEQALQSIHIRFRTALLLKYYQNLSQQESADIMNISIHAFESLLSRARKAMKKALNESNKSGEGP